MISLLMSSSSIVAVVDIGSNSTKALIAWLHEDLALRKIAEESYGCRLLIQKTFHLSPYQSVRFKNLKRF